MSFTLGFCLTLSINFGISISFHQELQMLDRSSILLLRLGEGMIDISVSISANDARSLKNSSRRSYFISNRADSDLP